MKFIKGLKILLTKTWYNLSFVLSMAATVIIGLWLLVQGSLEVSFEDPLQGIAISIVVSFQYFVITLIVASLTQKGRALFFESDTQLRSQVMLCVGLVILFMILGPITAIIGPVVGAGLTFLDALITAYFSVLLAWNVGESVSNKIATRETMKWGLFVVFLFATFTVFGYLYMFVGLEILLLEQQIVFLMFPLGMVILPIVTILFREKGKGPDQTTLMTLILFGLGLYYTYRLVNVADPTFTLYDIVLQFALLVYGLSTTIAKVEEIPAGPIKSISLILLVILSRVGTQVNRLLAAGTGWGNIVQVGVTSFTILNLALLGLVVPSYWMRERKKSTQE